MSKKKEKHIKLASYSFYLSLV